MKLRLEGTAHEIEAVLRELPSIVEVHRVSPFYPNRDSATVGCRYVTVVPPVAGPELADRRAAHIAANPNTGNEEK